jgi:ATP-binding cassette subfamily F protein 3
MISVDNITKSYGEHILFDQASFKINARERVGLVGRNGHGKTTLFRILIGEEHYEGGNLVIPKGYRIGHVQQQLKFMETSVLAEGMLGLQPAEKDHHWKVEKILAGLGFSNGDMQRPPESFSGGFQVRLNLAKVLVSEPDLLLLDEPTNYLDITSIRWIERFLLNWSHELMLITHDRSFMDRLVTHTLGIHRKKIRKISGNTEKYYTQIAQDEDIYEKTRLKNERRAKDMEQFISRFRAKARLAGMVQSRIKTLEKLDRKNKLEKMRALEFRFRSLPFRGKHIMTGTGISFGYPECKPLFSNLDLSINNGDRICVIGPNGKGKTTLLKILAGHLSPLDGQVAYHPSVVKGFYEQTNIQTLNDLNTIEEEILTCHPDVDRQLARNICGAMLFEGEAALKRIQVLSGGEKARVMLGKLLAKPANLLLLDEPSNHLDMESCDALIAALDNFDGTIIMITHNEMFLHALAQRLIVFIGDQVTTYDGGYQDFLNSGGWGDESEIAVSKTAGAAQKPQAAPKVNKKKLRRQRSAIIIDRSRELKPIESAIVKKEDIIEKKEKRLAQLNTDMVTAAQNQEGGRISDLSRQIHACQTTIDDCFSALDTLYEQKESLEKIYEKRLAELDEALEAPPFPDHV